MLYLIEQYGNEGRKYLKIGSSGDIDKRMKQYNTHCAEFNILDTFEGTYKEETILRNIFKELIIKNEWMLYDEKIISLWNGYKVIYEYFKNIKIEYLNLKNKYSNLVLENQRLQTSNKNIENDKIKEKLLKIELDIENIKKENQVLKKQIEILTREVFKEKPLPEITI